MITDSYDIETEPMINLFDFYGRRGDFADICLIIFSKEIHRHLLDSYESEIIATMPACNGDTHIYKTTYKGVTLPEGFAPTKIEGEDSIDEGLVITDGYGNEYVWVEVPKTGTIYKTAGLGIINFTDEEYSKIKKCPDR